MYVKTLYSLVCDMLTVFVIDIHKILTQFWFSLYCPELKGKWNIIVFFFTLNNYQVKTIIIIINVAECKKNSFIVREDVF